jgi:hypothetical protein
MFERLWSRLRGEPGASAEPGKPGDPSEPLPEEPGPQRESATGPQRATASREEPVAPGGTAGSAEVPATAEAPPPEASSGDQPADGSTQPSDPWSGAAAPTDPPPAAAAEPGGAAGGSSEPVSSRSPTANIDGRRYRLSELPEEIRQLLAELRRADRVIAMRRDRMNLLALGRRGLVDRLRLGLERVRPLDDDIQG